MQRPLPLEEIIRGAFLGPWRNLRVFSRALAVPLVSLVALTLTWHYAKKTLPYAVGWLFYLLYGLVFTLLAVACHRLVLIGSDTVTWRSASHWSWRHTRFLAWLFAIWFVQQATTFVVLNAAAFVAGMISNAAVLKLVEDSDWVTFLARIPGLYIFARLCVVLPATAIDRTPGLRRTWELTRRNGWRLVIVVGVLPWVISYMIRMLHRENPSVFETSLLVFSWTALFVVEIAALSLSYRELTNEADT